MNLEELAYQAEAGLIGQFPTASQFAGCGRKLVLK
jgi:hypothetical protein